MLGQRADSDVDVPGPGELQRVGQQVRDDLFPHLGVDDDWPGQLRGVDAQFQSRGFRCLAEHRGDVSRQGGEVSLDRPHRHLHDTDREPQRIKSQARWARRARLANS